MPKIDHVTLIYTDLSKMNQIPSEFIEPYLRTFLMAVVEGVGCGWTKPEEARADLQGVERFVSLFGGIHARIATSNQYLKLCDLSDEAMIDLCKKLFNDEEKFGG